MQLAASRIDTATNAKAFIAAPNARVESHRLCGFLGDVSVGTPEVKTYDTVRLERVVSARIGQEYSLAPLPAAVNSQGTEKCGAPHAEAASLQERAGINARYAARSCSDAVLACRFVRI